MAKHGSKIPPPIKPYFEINVNKWADFKLLMDSLVSTDAEVYFRGQCSADWGLISRFDREVIKKKIKVQNRATYQAIVLERFIHNSQPINPDFAWNDADKVLALAQHNGTATRLLDWTRSYWIAAFFAFKDNPNNPVSKKAAIWCLCPRHTNELTLGGGVRLNKTIIPTRNDRLSAQKGVFTILDSPSDLWLEQYLFSATNHNAGLIKYVLPRDLAKVALPDIYNTGNDHAKLLHDLEGAAATAMIEAESIGKTKRLFH